VGRLSKVAIIGAGNVGSSIAFSLMMSNAVSDIALIDINKTKAKGEALDLAHGLQFVPSVNSIQAGDDFSLIKNAVIVVMCAGIGQQKGQTRSDLLNYNVSIFKEIIPEIIKYNNECIILVVTNPLDVMTYVTHKLSGFSSCRVFGTGTVLDSARLRYLLGKHFDISPKDVGAHVLGEHGDSQFVWWSQASIAGIPLSQLQLFSQETMNTIYNKTKDAASQIISLKGVTNFAIAMVVTKIVRAILLDQSRVFTVSNIVDGVYGVSDVSLSLPMVVRRSGTCQKLSISLNDREQKFFLESALKIKKEINQALALL